MPWTVPAGAVSHAGARADAGGAASGRPARRAGAARRGCSRPRAGSAAELGIHDYVFLTRQGTGPAGSCALPGASASGRPPWSSAAPTASRGGSSTISAASWRISRCSPSIRGESQERAFPRQRILGSVVHASARVLAPAHVQVVAADRLLLGEPGGEVTGPPAEAGDGFARRRHQRRSFAAHPPRCVGQAVGQHEHESLERADALRNLQDARRSRTCANCACA